jgi:hypothetical protein
MRRSTIVVLVAVSLILAAALALDPLFHVGQNGYVAALTATFAGVLGGLPLALLVDRMRQEQEEKARSAVEARAAAEAHRAEQQRVSDILGLIRGELSDDEAMLDARTNTPWDVRTPFLRSDVWHALNASGATIGIPAALIDRIARAYHRIEATSFVERETLRLSLDPMVRTIQWPSVEAAGAGPSPLSAVRNILSATDGATRQAIREAVLAIDERATPQTNLQQHP